MAENLGDAVLNLTVDASGLNKGLAGARRNTDSAMSRMGESSKRVGRSLTGIVAGLSAALTLPIVGLAKVAYDELGEIQKANAVTSATIKTMGLDAQFTTKSVQDLAAKMQQLSGVDDQVIQGAINIGLTFKNLAKLGPGAMEQTTRLALGMSEVMGMDVRSAMTSLGKAMQDPVKGATALTRTGTLAKSELEQLKNMAKAGATEFEQQQFILQALEKQYGKAAAAAGKEFLAQLAILKDQLAGVGAELLSRLIPTITRFIKFVSNLATRFSELSPRMKTFIAIGAALAAAAGPMIALVGVLAIGIGALATVTWSAVLPVVAVVAALALLGAAFIVLYKKSDTFRTMVNASFEKLKAGVVTVFNELRKTVSVWIGWIKAFWKSNGASILAQVQKVFNGIRTHIATVLSVIKNVVVAALRVLRGDWSGALQAMKSALSTAWGGIKKIFTEFLPWIAKTLGAIILKAGDIAGRIGDAIIDGIKNAIQAGASAIVSAVTNLASDALNALKKKLKISSPSRVMMMEVGLPIADGIAEGITSGARNAAKAAAGLMQVSGVSVETADRATLGGRVNASMFANRTHTVSTASNQPMRGTNITMNFRGDPDPWSATRQAAFAVRSAGVISR